MKIRLKIALTFTLLATIVLLFSFSFIYYLSAKYTEKDFFERLEEKANLVAWKYFEQDETTKSAYQDILVKNNRNLPEAQDLILNVAEKGNAARQLNRILPQKLGQRLLNGNTVWHKSGERQFVGIYYPDNQGTFLVVVSSIDKYGIHKQQFLLELLLMIFVAGIILIFFMGRLYAQRVMSPIAVIMKNVRNISARNLSQRLEERNGSDELAELTRMFNQMLGRLEESFNMQKNFISNASHELKNPLTAILGESEIALSRRREPEEYISTLNRIVSEAERLDLLTKNLLGLAQADSDSAGLKRIPVRMVELLWELETYYDSTSYSDRIRLHLPVPNDSLSSLVTIMGIPTLLKTALINVIDNACKFSGEQLVSVTLTSGEDAVRIDVEDHGIGIPENEKENLFQPFFRASNTVAYKGSGIGLSLTAKIIGLHGGKISIPSISGRGTIVSIFLPLKKD